MTTNPIDPQRLQSRTGILLDPLQVQALVANRPFFVGRAEVKAGQYKSASVVHLRFSAAFADTYRVRPSTRRRCDRARCGAKACTHERWMAAPVCGAGNNQGFGAVIPAPIARDPYTREVISVPVALDQVCPKCVQIAHQIGHVDPCVHGLIGEYCRSCQRPQVTNPYKLAEDCVVEMLDELPTDTCIEELMAELLAMGVAPWWLGARTGWSPEALDALVAKTLAYRA